MSNIIDLSSIREKHIQEVEAKAGKEYNAVKIDDDSYIIPANVVKSDDIDQAFRDSNMYKDEALRKAIEGIKANDGDYISISCKSILEGNKKVLEVVNISSEEQEIRELIVDSELDHYEREMLVNMIAYTHKDKGLYVTFYLNYNFELFEQLVSE